MLKDVGRVDGKLTINLLLEDSVADHLGTVVKTQKLPLKTVISRVISTFHDVAVHTKPAEPPRPPEYWYVREILVPSRFQGFTARPTVRIYANKRVPIDGVGCWMETPYNLFGATTLSLELDTTDVRRLEEIATRHNIGTADILRQAISWYISNWDANRHNNAELLKRIRQELGEII